MSLKKLANRFFNALKKTLSPKTDFEEQASPKTLDGAPTPGWLKLEFSKAADIPHIDEIFKPEIKNKIDPNGYVLKRDKDIFERTISNGGAAVLKDKEDNVYTLCMAYHIHKDAKAKKTAHHDYTEIGTTITRLARYQSAHIVITALSLKEWWDRDPTLHVVAAIDPDNAGSKKVFNTHLGWEELPDQAEQDELSRLSNETLASGATHAESWHHCSGKTYAKQAQELLNFVDRGSIIQKDTKHEIKVDFSTLDDIGLTRDVLEKIANQDLNQLRRRAPGPYGPDL